MSIIGSVNGYPLLATPLTPGQRQVDWTMQNVNGAVANPFTGKQQIHSWLAGWWEGVVTMPTMKRPLAMQWVAFLAQCQGRASVFYFGDGLGVNAQGSAIGQGLTSGSFQSEYTLTTKGWTPSQYALFSPGDWIQIGYRLYMVMDSVSSDGNGNASFAIWPQLRENPPNGTPIITNNAKGLFRLGKDSVQYTANYDKTYRLSFPIHEAI